jgi:Phosphate-induced protein 1 conserved region
MKHRSSVAMVALLCGAFMASSTAVAQDELNGASDRDHDSRPDGRRNRTRGTRNEIGRAGAGGAVVQGNGINYHGGPVMHGTVNAYYIWYGEWATLDPNANAILTDWGSTIGGSPYENINTTYGDTTANVSGAIALVGTTQMPSTTFGKSLSDSSIASIVSKALATGALPTDSTGVYFVLTAPGIAETSGFLTQYCGWHTYGNINGANIKYAFIGDAAGPNLGSCAWQTASSPNGDPAVDAMVSVMSHELEESASDPNLNAWYDSSGEEDADKCAWTFGTTYSASGGGIANMKLGTRDFLIQQNWANAGGGYCALSYTNTPDFSLSVSPTSQTLPSTGGTTGNYAITATPTGGFAGNVTYTILGLQGWAAASVSGSTFTVTAVSPVSGTYPFTIQGTSGSLVHTTSASLVISQPAPPSFTVSVSPASQSVNRGGKVTYTVTVAPVNGFTGTVALTASGAKTGLTLTLNPTSVTAGGTSTLTASTTNSAKRATDTLTVTGKSGSTSKSASVTLKIQ